MFVRIVRYKLPFARKSPNCKKKLQLPFLFYILWWGKTIVGCKLRIVRSQNSYFKTYNSDTLTKKLTFCNSDLSKSQKKIRIVRQKVAGVLKKKKFLGENGLPKL